MNRIKKMPIFYPIFFLINVLIKIFVYLPQWMLGAWWCEDCDKQFGVDDMQVSTQHGDICTDCYDKEYGSGKP